MNEKHYKDLDLVNKILLKFKNLGKVHDYVIIGNMLYLSCDVKTDSSYFSVIENKILYGFPFEDDQEYIEDYIGGIAIIDLKNFEIVKVYCFFDFIDCVSLTVSIEYKNDDFLFLSNGIYCYVLYIDDYNLIPFGGLLYKIYDPYLITFPYGDYFDSSAFLLLDTKTKTIIDLYDIIPIDKSKPYYEYRLDSCCNELYDNLYIINNKLLFTDTKSGIEYSVPMEIALGKTKITKTPQTLENEAYDVKTINEILPYVGISLGKMSLYNVQSNDIIIDESSYIAQLFYQVKYRFRKDKISELAQLIARKIPKHDFDIIVPVPSSNPNKEYQPLNEIIKIISNILQIPYDLDYLISNMRKPVRLISDSIERKSILENSLHVTNTNKYKNKRILLIDDHIHKGDTINTCIRKCCCNDIFVLVIARNSIVPYLELPF